MVTYEDILRYLNSEMPDIGGIFPAPVVNDPDPDPDPDLDPTDQVLTPEQLFLLQQQQQKLDGGDNDREGNNLIDTTNNAGITGIKGVLTALGFMSNPFGFGAGLGLKKGFDNMNSGGLDSLRNLKGSTFALSPTLSDYFKAKRMEKKAAIGADRPRDGGDRGSRRGDADIAGKDRGSFKTDDTAGFF